MHTSQEPIIDETQPATSSRLVSLIEPQETPENGRLRESMRISNPGSAHSIAILNGPVLSTMLRLAIPTIVVLIAQTLVGVVETYYLGFLGTEALVGVALVFPFSMLMTMMSNGGIGGGVASAIARAKGAGRTADSDALVLHALILGGFKGEAQHRA